MNNINNFNEFALTNEQSDQTNGGCYRRYRRRTCRTRTYTRTSYCGYTPPPTECPAPVEVEPTPEPIVIAPEPAPEPISQAPTIIEVDPTDGCEEGDCQYDAFQP